MFEPKNFDSKKKLEGISERTMTEHIKLYEGYVKKTNEIMEKLKSVDKGAANATYSELRALKVELSFAYDAMVNHEIYFGHLGGDGKEPQGKFAEDIEKNFGSFQNFKADMKATGLAARGWVWLAYNWDTKTLFNYLGDSHNTYLIWNSSILVCLDVFEHAYWADFGTARASYIDAFFNNMDWKLIEKKYESMEDMSSKMPQRP